MALDSEKDILQLKKRLCDLAEKSYRQNVFTFSTFLGLAELSVYYQMEQELLFAYPVLFGGDEKAERKLIRFGSPEEFGYEESYPISCIHVKPLLSKFSDDFSHRDFLGALMNLGITRECIGDIRMGQKEGFVYCLTPMADFVCKNLLQIKHTHVTATVVEQIAEVEGDKPLVETVLASSLRLDGCIAKLYHLSRNESLNLFTAGRVFADGRLVQNNSRMLKPGETINVRGYGKFVFKGVKYETKKGKLCMETEVYR